MIVEHLMTRLTLNLLGHMLYAYNVTPDQHKHPRSLISKLDCTLLYNASLYIRINGKFSCNLFVKHGIYISLADSWCAGVNLPTPYSQVSINMDVNGI